MYYQACTYTYISGFTVDSDGLWGLPIWASAMWSLCTHAHTNIHTEQVYYILKTVNLHGTCTYHVRMCVRSQTDLN